MNRKLKAGMDECSSCGIYREQRKVEHYVRSITLLFNSCQVIGIFLEKVSTTYQNCDLAIKITRPNRFRFLIEVLGKIKAIVHV